jgi:hypothetical protein
MNTAPRFPNLNRHSATTTTSITAGAGAPSLAKRSTLLKGNGTRLSASLTKTDCEKRAAEEARTLPLFIFLTNVKTAFVSLT